MLLKNDEKDLIAGNYYYLLIPVTAEQAKPTAYTEHHQQKLLQISHSINKLLNKLSILISILSINKLL